MLTTLMRGKIPPIPHIRLLLYFGEKEKKIDTERLIVPSKQALE